MSAVDHLSSAMERLRAMDRTGLAQAFTAKNGSAVLEEIVRLQANERAADRLAKEVAALIDRKVLDSRSPAADALLDYKDGAYFSSENSHSVREA